MSHGNEIHEVREDCLTMRNELARIEHRLKELEKAVKLLNRLSRSEGTETGNPVPSGWE